MLRKNPVRTFFKHYHIVVCEVYDSEHSKRQNKRFVMTDSCCSCFDSMKLNCQKPRDVVLRQAGSK